MGTPYFDSLLVSTDFALWTANQFLFSLDIYTDALMSLARTINPAAPKMFTATLSPYSKSYKPPKSSASSHHNSFIPLDTAPRKLEWTLSPSLLAGIRFAETRLSDLICQNDVQALEFESYGSEFMKKYGFSPDGFVQMAFQAAWFGLYGQCYICKEMCN
jgi:carnitine O-acetyltransferase